MDPDRPAARDSRLMRGWRRVTAFHDVSVVIGRHRRSVGVETQVEIRPVDTGNVADARTMEPEERIAEFRAFLARGDAGYYGYLEGRVVHRSWVRVGPLSAPLWHGYGRLDLPAGARYVHYCETAPAARGRHAYPAALAHIAAEFGARSPQGVWISTDERNTASVHGITRGGFDFVTRAAIRVRFGVGHQTDTPLVITGASG
jgi:hypothetical protein